MATASSSASTSPPRIKVKKEICTDNDTIKELAETAMNDILGWYGYDSVDRLELAANNVPSAAASNVHEEDGSSGVCSKPAGEPSISSSSSKTKPSAQASLMPASSKHHHHHLQQPSIGGQFLSRQPDDLTINPLPSTSSNSERRGREMTPSLAGRTGRSGSPPATAPTSSTTARNGIVLHHQAHQHHHHAPVPAGGGESSTSEKDSSRESSKSPMLMKMLDKQEQTCQWCRKVIPSHQTGILGTTEGMIFCTEACFSQSRRASFKRAKTCDWCRHVRHAVSYVDFQDGASQLQFCSDKCLNQYKMQIFCNETQAHLEMNPHLKEKSSSTGSLITPELWMKNCKSCSISPVSDRSESVSPVPSIPVRSSPEPSPITLRSPTPAKKPLISVAPPSKLLSKSLQQSSLGRSNPKNSRKRRTGHRPIGGLHGTAASKRSTSTQQTEFSSGMNSSCTSINNNNLTIPNNNLTGSPPTIASTGPPKSAPNVQDLRILQKKHNSVVNLASNDGPSMVGFDGRDLTAAGGSLGPPVPPPPPPLNIPPQFLPPPMNLLRASFFPLNPAQLRFGSGLANLQSAQPPSHGPPMGPPPSPLPGGPLGPGNRPPIPNMFGFGSAPPVTILVPYPIIVPLPLPIPVPIPVIDFLKAALPKEDNGKTGIRSEQNKATANDEKMEPGGTAVTVDSDETMGEELPESSIVEEDSDAPLDFTVGGSGKHPDRDVASSGAKVTVWSEHTEHTVPVEMTSETIDETATYALSTIVSNGSKPIPAIAEDEDHRDDSKHESAKRLLPKFKITRLEVGKQRPEVGEGNGSGEELPKEETDIERERKEMVERSRPLRKRKRLVVQQHLHTKHELQEPSNDGRTDELEYGTGIGLRSGSKSQ
ncbi:sine oculis-binding protein homolog B [Anopheles marshallii]|uniref:sine oculis-binding protein homolog B n=1 Tax=Anopheles marshallii TaxID=1521116 RepID=UPI00237C2143|nr:sine oculis-binding protein homolog B [Anopheles marshallii]